MMEARFGTSGSAYYSSTSTQAEIPTESKAKRWSRSAMSHSSSLPKPPKAASGKQDRTTVSSGSSPSLPVSHTTLTRSGTISGSSQVSGSSTANATFNSSKIPPSTSSTRTSSPHNSPGHSSASGLSAAAEKAVIAATIIGGAFILALLIFFLWKRRKSRNNFDAAGLRPPSTTTFLSSTTRDANLTALPAHRERRIQMATANDDLLQVPPRLRDLYSYDPSLQDVWKTTNPPTPTTQQHQSENNETSQMMRQPEMTQVSRASPMIQALSNDDDIYPAMNESIYVPSIVDLETGPQVHTSAGSQRSLKQQRNSGSSSFTTAKSRLDARSLASTISSLPGIRTMREWMSFQPEAQRRVNRMREGEAGPSRKGSGTFLKNKATKPNLAPLPTRQLSIQHLRRESDLSARKAPSVAESKEIEDVDAEFPEDGVIS